MGDKPKLTKLFRENLETPEGKYLVKRRDGTVAEWPSFVLGARDPMVPWTLRFYAILGFLMGEYSWEMTKAVWRWAGVCKAYRLRYGKGDPGMGKHWVDDPATVLEMRKGYSA